MVKNRKNRRFRKKNVPKNAQAVRYRSKYPGCLDQSGLATSKVRMVDLINLGTMVASHQSDGEQVIYSDYSVDFFEENVGTDLGAVTTTDYILITAQNGAVFTDSDPVVAGTTIEALIDGAVDKPFSLEKLATITTVNNQSPTWNGTNLKEIGYSKLKHINLTNKVNALAKRYVESPFQTDPPVMWLITMTYCTAAVAHHYIHWVENMAYNTVTRAKLKLI